MEVIKKYQVVVVSVLIIVIGAVFFFYRLYQYDTQALKNFSASYEKFDRAIADFSASKTDDSEVRAIDALAELNTKVVFRLSSLIKNDGVIPPVAHEIADLAGKELFVLDAYQSAIKNKKTGARALAQEYGDRTAKRKAAYARFQELAGLKD